MGAWSSLATLPVSIPMIDETRSAMAPFGLGHGRLAVTRGMTLDLYEAGSGTLTPKGSKSTNSNNLIGDAGCAIDNDLVVCVSEAQPGNAVWFRWPE